MMNGGDCAPKYRPGDPVFTRYGAGVIAGSENGRLVVRLWRQNGKSLASAALAYLDSNSIIRKIPAAPGLITALIDPRASRQSDVRVWRFNHADDTFLVSYVSDKDSPEDYAHDRASSSIGSNSLHSHVTLPSSMPLQGMDCNIAPLFLVESRHLADAPSAKFYPLLQTLMQRADDALYAASDLLRSQPTRQLVNKTGDVLRKSVDRVSCNASANAIGDYALAAASSAESALSTTQVDDTVKQVLRLVKEKDLKDLLETCRSRLAEMTDNGHIPDHAAKALSNSAINFNVETVPSSFKASIDGTRKAALQSLECLLQELDVNSSNLERLQDQISRHFAQAFDSLSSAATSDESLNMLFDSLREKTQEWEAATGRILETRSGGLFVEGASRLQQRAAAILGKGHIQWAGEIGEQFLKSITEGDIAVAKLKSIELADAVKDNLVQAIEVRSEAVGGLDGIIASALSRVNAGGTTSNDALKDLLGTLQDGASSSAANAQETLLTLLSSQSAYRDKSLLQIEKVLCSLSSHFGDSISADDIARVARGDGGTAKLFEPIARKAMAEINTQLDVAESSIADPTTLTVLSRVRQITKGELSLSSVLDDLVNILNDDSVVQASEIFAQQSEQVLDIIESVNANDAVSGALKLVEKAGITKQSVISELEKLDVENLMSTAGNAVNDERARQRLLSTATDAALDFALRILPSMQVPPFDGVKDGLIYRISNLSMEGFKVRKEDIHIELAGMHATQSTRNKGTAQMSSSKNGKKMRVKPTELLIIDIQSISAVLDDAAWSFEQTYMPYLKASGLANIRFYGGAIRLQFELRRQRKESNPFDWEPVLCLHDRRCTIAEVDLSLQGESRLTWIVNKAATVFKGPLRDYIVRTVGNALVRHSGWILERMNDILSPHWGLILQTASLKMSDLVETDDWVVSKEVKVSQSEFIELVWRDQLPLGINLLLNDESGYLKVVDFPRGSQARAVCERRNPILDPDIFKGARIVAVNGSQYGGDLDDLFTALKEPSRPKTIRFEIAGSEEAERVQSFVSGSGPSNSRELSVELESRSFCLRTVTFSVGEDVGISFCRSLDDGIAVDGFLEGEGGVVLAAERSQRIRHGDLLVQVNNSPVASSRDALAQLETAVKARPLELSFVEPYLYVSEIARSGDGAGGGDELRLVRKENKIVIGGYNNVSGKAERCGIMIGDHLVFVNGQPVGIGSRWLDVQPSPNLQEVERMIANDAAYPIGLTFARPVRDRETRGAFRDDEAETICVTLERIGELGCVLQETAARDLIVADFKSVAGNLQTALRQYPNGLSIQAINGQSLPSYASEGMVKSAIDRSWNVEGKVELWLCDDQLKDWLRKTLRSD